MATTSKIATAFHNPALVSQSWFVAARSREVRPGQVRSWPLLQRRIALYRDARGVVRALDARCPHLGADLGAGRVVFDQVECAFHGWRIGPEGRCGGRETRVYPVLERWGLIWIFNGPRPLFALPDLDGGEWLPLRLPARRIECHPHLVIANGLDLAHYESLHGITLTGRPELTSPAEHQLRVTLQGRPPAGWQRVVTGTRRRDFAASFTTHGASLAWATVEQPLRFHMLFTGRPGPGGVSCETQTVLFVPRRAPYRSMQALALMYTLLAADAGVLNRIEFRPDFTEADQPLRAFAAAVNGLGTW